MGQNQSQDNNLPEGEEYDEEREVTVTPEKQAPVGTAKLYQHTGGVQNGKWSLVNPSVTPRFLLEGGEGSDEEDDEREEEEEAGSGERVWYLAVGKREVLAAVSNELNLQSNPQQKRVDFVANGVWALRFKEETDYKEFVAEYEAALFENNYGMELTTENQAKIFGQDYALAFGKGQDADEMMFDAGKFATSAVFHQVFQKRVPLESRQTSCHLAFASIGKLFAAIGATFELSATE